MQRGKKRALSLLLAVAMIFGVASAALTVVSADTLVDVQYKSLDPGAKDVVSANGCKITYPTDNYVEGSGACKLDLADKVSCHLNIYADNRTNGTDVTGATKLAFDVYVTNPAIFKTSGDYGLNIDGAGHESQWGGTAGMANAATVGGAFRGTHAGWNHIVLPLTTTMIPDLTNVKVFSLRLYCEQSLSTSSTDYMIFDNFRFLNDAAAASDTETAYAAAVSAMSAMYQLPAAADVTAANETAITSARAAYTALSDTAKAKVVAPAMTKLTNAEEALDIVKNSKDVSFRTLENTTDIVSGNGLPVAVDSTNSVQGDASVNMTIKAGTKSAHFNVYSEPADRTTGTDITGATNIAFDIYVADPSIFQDAGDMGINIDAVGSQNAWGATGGWVKAAAVRPALKACTVGWNHIVLPLDQTSVADTSNVKIVDLRIYCEQALNVTADTYLKFDNIRFISNTTASHGDQTYAAAVAVMKDIYNLPAAPKESDRATFDAVKAAYEGLDEATAAYVTTNAKKYLAAVDLVLNPGTSYDANGNLIVKSWDVEDFTDLAVSGLTTSNSTSLYTTYKQTYGWEWTAKGGAAVFGVTMDVKAGVTYRYEADVYVKNQTEFFASEGATQFGIAEINGVQKAIGNKYYNKQAQKTDPLGNPYRTVSYLMSGFTDSTQEVRLWTNANGTVTPDVILYDIRIYNNDTNALVKRIIPWDSAVSHQVGDKVTTDKNIGIVSYSSKVNTALNRTTAPYTTYNGSGITDSAELMGNMKATGLVPGNNYQFRYTVKTNAALKETYATMNAVDGSGNQLATGTITNTQVVNELGANYIDKHYTRSISFKAGDDGTAIGSISITDGTDFSLCKVELIDLDTLGKAARDMIAALPDAADLTVDNEADVVAARAAFDALAADQIPLVTNIDKLTADEAQLVILKREFDKDGNLIMKKWTVSDFTDLATSGLTTETDKLAYTTADVPLGVSTNYTVSANNCFLDGIYNGATVTAGQTFSFNVRYDCTWAANNATTGTDGYMVVGIQYNNGTNGGQTDNEAITWTANWLGDAYKTDEALGYKYKEYTNTMTNNSTADWTIESTRLWNNSVSDTRGTPVCDFHAYQITFTITNADGTIASTKVLSPKDLQGITKYHGVNVNQTAGSAVTYSSKANTALSRTAEPYTTKNGANITDGQWGTLIGNLKATDLAPGNYKYVFSVLSQYGLGGNIMKLDSVGGETKTITNDNIVAAFGTNEPKNYYTVELPVTVGDDGIANASISVADNSDIYLYRVELVNLSFAVQQVIAAIDALPAADAVTMANAAAITAARTAYDALSESQKAQVTNYSKLTEDESKLIMRFQFKSFPSRDWTVEASKTADSGQDNTNYVEGTGSAWMKTIAGGNQMFWYIYDNDDTPTDITGATYVSFDFYTEDPNIFSSCADCGFQLGTVINNWGGDGVGISAATLKAMTLKAGWNHVVLKIDYSGATANWNPAAMRTIRFYAVGMTAGRSTQRLIRLDDLCFINDLELSHDAYLAQAKAVSASIWNIPTALAVKEENRAVIESARAAYDALDATQQAYVVNYSRLTAAEAALRGEAISVKKWTIDDFANMADSGLTTYDGRTIFTPYKETLGYAWNATGGAVYFSGDDKAGVEEGQTYTWQADILLKNAADLNTLDPTNGFYGTADMDTGSNQKVANLSIADYMAAPEKVSDFGYTYRTVSVPLTETVTGNAEVRIWANATDGFTPDAIVYAIRLYDSEGTLVKSFNPTTGGHQTGSAYVSENAVGIMTYSGKANAALNRSGDPYDTYNTKDLTNVLMVGNMSTTLPAGDYQAVFTCKQAYGLSGNFATFAIANGDTTVASHMLTNQEVVDKLGGNATLQYMDISVMFTVTAEGTYTASVVLPDDGTDFYLRSVEIKTVPTDPAVEAVKAAIAALPATDSLTAADKTAVDAAKALFDALTADQQARVSNSSTLNADVNKIAALGVDAMITALPAKANLKLTDKAAVDAARAAYNALTADQKSLVKGLDTLTADEGQITNLAAAQPVIDQITALPEPTAVDPAKDATAVNAAQAAYNGLSDAQKALVPAASKQKLDDCVAALNPIVYGDVNKDGKINTTDALLTLRAAVGKITFTAEQIKIADVNGDGKINTTDALMVLRRAVNPSYPFPVEAK